MGHMDIIDTADYNQGCRNGLHASQGCPRPISHLSGIGSLYSETVAQGIISILWQFHTEPLGCWKHQTKGAVPAAPAWQGLASVERVHRFPWPLWPLDRPRTDLTYAASGDGLQGLQTGG